MSLRLAIFAAAAVAFGGLDRLRAGDDEFAKAIEKGAALERYTFQTDEKPGKGAGTGVEGAYQKGQPVSFKADQFAFYKSGDALVYKMGDAWKRSKRGIESDPLTVLGSVAKVNAARLPHEEIASLGKALTDVKKSDRPDDGCTVYSGDLTPEGAAKLAPTEFHDVARAGTAKIWVNGDGVPVKYRWSIRLQGTLGNAQIDGTAEKTVKLGDIGSAKVEAPEAAKKALE
jgi:hypothetical protein